MERISRLRSRILLVIFALIVGFFAFKLYNEQIIKTDGNTDNSITYITRTRIKASRGDLLDTNGNVLVGNRASYDLTVNHYVLLNAKGTSKYVFDLTELCQEKGIEYEDHFPMTKTRPFTYTLTEQNSVWQGYFQRFLARMGDLDSDITAPLLIEHLRDAYDLPAEWTDEEARRVIGVYYELTLRKCINYMPLYTFIYDASDEALATVSEMNIPGMNVEASTVREYKTDYAAHILGYVGPMNAEQWKYYENIDGYDMDAEIGQDGLEAAYEEYLHGVDGWRIDEMTEDGTLIRSYYETEPQAGANVETSIDINLQMVAEDSLASVIEGLRANPDEDGWDAEGGAVVALDVKTGQILACASYPTYNLETFFEDYETLAEDEYDPLYNRALLATYPPGSTYKMTMVIAAMKEHIIDSKTEFYDYGMFDRDDDPNDKYDKFEVSCLAYAYGYSHGNVNAAKALRDSCNYFFYEIGDRIDVEAMDEVGKGLGLGEKSGAELPEYKGYRANPETKAELHTDEDTGWYKGDSILAAIGQSEHRYTPIQLAVYASTIANKGTRMKCTFMNRIVSADYQHLLDENTPTVISELEIPDEAYQAVKEGMIKVSHELGGTAYETFKDYPIQVASKTGTAQTDIPDASDNGAFVCFAPAEDPQIAIAVYVEKGGHGATIATVGRDIMDSYFSVSEAGDVNLYENQYS